MARSAARPPTAVALVVAALVLAWWPALCLASSDEHDSDDCSIISPELSGGETCPFVYQLDDAPLPFAAAGNAVMQVDDLGLETVVLVGGTKQDGERTSRVRTALGGGFADDPRVWSANTPTGLPAVSQHVVLAPTDTTMLVVSGSTGTALNNGFTYRSTDGGWTWALVASNSMPARAYAAGACVNVTGQPDRFCYVCGGATGPKQMANDMWQYVLATSCARCRAYARACSVRACGDTWLCARAAQLRRGPALSPHTRARANAGQLTRVIPG